MSARPSLDAIVVGSGPNGLAAAVALAREGHSVRVYEAQPTIGGGARSAELTRPGFVHDMASTVHALALLSPFLKSLPLSQFGLQFAHPEAPFAHPLDDGTAVVVERSIDATVSALGLRDGRAYGRLVRPLVEQWDTLMEALLGPFSVRHPITMAKFGRHAIRSAEGLAKHLFESERARAMLAGVAAHSMVPLDKLATSGYTLGLVIAAHAVGWPVSRGGAQRLANALAAYLRSLGGEVVTDTPVESLASLPPSRVVLLDVTPRQLSRIAGDRLSRFYRWRLSRYRYGPGVFKMDWALNSPVPWRAPECGRAGTLHLGGSLAEIAAGERASWEGRHAERPYVLVTQPSLFDPTRAPRGRHTLWAYCHVPNGSTVDMRPVLERQIERYAPGFRDCIEETHVMSPADLERSNANLVGGDLGGGAGDLMQLYARPVARLNPYRTSIDNVFLCSSSTPPGVGVHGMSGYHAARAAMKALR
ncbi:MAG TPA: NAD(P)/FAD-dependent oxidoreductase [Gemmatimonadaceae bacterium]|nr:NAD(P)/FAD-dependent oxidoreductase [Gemmatimonadaceae bacterium]